MNDCPFRYPGQYEDIETGLYYNRFRYYSADEGVYLSQDPMGLKGGNKNHYSYVRDTNSWIDIFGLAEQGRDAQGKFLPKNPGDSVPGSDAAADVVKDFESDPKYDVLGEEISFKDQDTGQRRRYDIVVQDVDTGEIIGVEVKNSQTASYGKAQKTFDGKVNSGNHNIVPTGNKAKVAGVDGIDKVTVIRCN
ncbi:RHS repeat-associated core domain-containing protein [uncultured Aquimarina sp.]|uniref:RHS repeat-associated core domain-containing protein n=1 Tax=uncultured Aquimarina sp. TaxID=575652 RepID=UPI00261C7704|nr:RHS repeat-associated core domain-containing protein [uncultured Aquimarina sp.]